MKLEKQIQKAVEDAAERKHEFDSKTTRYSSESAFIAGANYLLPLIEKLIEQRDDNIRYREDLRRPSEKIAVIKMYNEELLKLLGEHK